jgi:tetratricopeptide (TPR) repeat protein
MKKILVLLIVASFSLFTIAQKKAKPFKEADHAFNNGKLDIAWTQIKLACEDSLTKNEPKTWFLRGQIAQAIAQSKDSTVKLIMDNAPIEAYDAYEKSIDIDPKKKYSKDVEFQFLTLSPITVNAALAEFSAQKFDKAFDLFELNYKIESTSIFKNIDTTNIYNCGLAAINAKKYDKAIEYLNKAISYNYGGGNTFSLLKTAYIGKGDSINALISLKKGFEKYPNELQIMIDLVNYYMVANQSVEALNFLKMAEVKEPNNKSFCFAEGILYEKMNNFDSAIISYTRSTEIDPKYFDGYYYLGRIYYNKAVEVNNQASNEKDDAKYNELQKKRDDLFKKSIPFFEKAHEIDAKDKDCAETLKSLYFRFGLNDKSAKLKEEMGWTN